MITKIVVPWHNQDQIDKFLHTWRATGNEPFLLLQKDEDKSGCALTKNRGISKAIYNHGAEVVVVLDDDCFPSFDAPTLEALIDLHLKALEPQPVEMFQTVTQPPSRGTPYFNRTITMPVAASMGFWTEIGDYDAPGQLVHGATHPMTFDRGVIHGKYFPLCGMNLAFKADWFPWCEFINVPRFDDIWQGFLWQKKAYSMGHCFNLDGPLVRHSRQSNVWQNLRDESLNMEANETIWQKIHASKNLDYYALKKEILNETQK